MTVLARLPAAWLGVLLVFASTACGTSTAALPYTPFTGIRVSAADLFAGSSCGEGPGQIFEYVAVVSPHGDGGTSSDGSIAATAYPCTADAVFQSLPATGTTSFTLKIYAYGAAAAASVVTCDGGACPFADPKQDFGATAQWTTECVALQEVGDNTLAQCGPLQPAGAPSTAADGR